MSPIRSAAAVILLATGSLLPACGGGTTTETQTPTVAVSVNPGSLTVEQGATGNVTLTIIRGGGFTGEVSASVSGLPTGVTVSVSPATLGSAVTSAIVMVAVAQTVAPGSYTATVKGTAVGVGETSTTYTLIVTQLPDFAMSASPGALSIAAGSSDVSTISIARSGFTSNVALSLVSPPTGITGTFNPASTTDNSAVVTLNVASTVSAGLKVITIQGVGGSITKTTTIALTVTPQPTHTLTLSPTSLQIVAGNNKTTTVTIARSNFTGPVSLALDNPPTGVTASFDVQAPTGNTAVMTLSVAGTVVPGSYPITLKGTATGAPSSVVLTLTVVTAAIVFNQASVTVAQGQSAQATVTITRSPALTGPISLTLDGRPNPSRMSFGPNPATASTATLSIDAQTTLPGTYPITVYAITGAAVVPTATFNLIVTPAVGATVDYRFCYGAPSWFARKDGNGIWSQVTPTVAGGVTTFSFSITSYGAIAYTVASVAIREEMSRVANVSGGQLLRSNIAGAGASPMSPVPAPAALFNTFVVHGTAAELRTAGACQAATANSSSLQVTATGIPAGQTGVFQIRGNAQLNFSSAGTQTLTGLNTGTSEWLAILIPTSGAWTSYRRGTVTIPGGAVSFDMTNAPPLLAAAVNVTGTVGGTFQHQIGFRNGYEGVALFNIGGNTASTTIQGFSDVLPGDLFIHAFLWYGPVVNGVEDVLQTFTYSGIFGALTVAAPTTMPAFTVTQLAPIPNQRLRMTGTIPSVYQNTFLQASFYDGQGQVFLQAYPGYLAAVGTVSTYQLDIPDFAGTNYPLSANLGTLVSTAVLGSGNTFAGGPIVSGSREIQATHYQPWP